MGFRIPPINLGMVDISRATVNSRLIMHLTNGWSEPGQLVLQLCHHSERRAGQRFCLDATSHHSSLTQQLKLSKYVDENGVIDYFPHINLAGLPAVGDRPTINIHVDHRLQRIYVLNATITDFSVSNVADMVRDEAFLATA